MSNPTSDPSLPPREVSLLTTVSNMHDGRFASEVEDLHRKAVAYIVGKGGKGKITLTLDYEKVAEGITIKADAAIKLPPKSARAEFIYADEDGKTYLDAPDQTELPFPKLHVPNPSRAAV